MGSEPTPNNYHNNYVTVSSHNTTLTLADILGMEAKI